MKQCSACHKEKEDSEFYKRKDRESGLASHCKECIKGKTKLWKLLNPERAIESVRQWRDNNPERVLSLCRQYHLTHLKYAKESARIWREEHRAENRKRLKEWHDRSYSKWKATILKRKALTKDAQIGDPEDIHRVYAKCRSAEVIKCRWCKSDTTQGNRHVDHIIPLSKGGAHAADNLCISCPTCNLRKGAKLPDEFRKEGIA